MTEHARLAAALSHNVDKMAERQPYPTESENNEPKELRF